MSLEICRRIRGNLHGSIDISHLEDKVIAHPMFQRLRRVRQTAFLGLVFPGATHTRFEHSLGVMHLAGKAWNKLQANQKRIENSCLEFGSFAEREQQNHGGILHGLLAPTFTASEKIFSNDYPLKCLRLAALLHDVGHAPFSHSSEKFLPSLSQVYELNPNLPSYLQDYLKKEIQECKRLKKSDSEAVSHELFTILMVDKIFTDLLEEDPQWIDVSAQDIISVINPEIAPSQDSFLNNFGLYRLCHELISGEIDIDRFDYLQRDSKECGVVHGMFDVERIMDSLGIYFNPDDQRFHLAIKYNGLHAFEDYLRARLSMYTQLYFHRTSVACEAMLQHMSRKLGGWRLPAAIDDYWRVDEHNIMEHFVGATQSQILDEQEKQKFIQLIENFLWHRKLWKLVYESTSFAHQQDSQKVELENITKLLDEANISFEKVSSSNLMTKFRKRNIGESSSNYLRLIKEDMRQFPRVEAIEDYSSVISQKTKITIHRIYVNDQVDAKKAKTLLRAYFK